MHPTDVKHIRETVEAAQRFAHDAVSDGCDVSDIDELAASVENELKRPLPNPTTLSTYLNSMRRSLFPQHHGVEMVAQLDQVMRTAGLLIDPSV
jgi:hypothetical protein